jgi:hypothetical protein
MTTGKITLITPPDIFENSNTSILLVHLTDQEQDMASAWLGANEVPNDINIYLYNGEDNVTWFLYAMSRCEYKYINMECVTYITQALSGYMLGKSNTYYKTDNQSISDVYNFINSNRVDSVEHFLKSIFSDKTNY